jgi:hypothetical protein
MQFALSVEELVGFLFEAELTGGGRVLAPIKRCSSFS